MKDNGVVPPSRSRGCYTSFSEAISVATAGAVVIAPLSEPCLECVVPCLEMSCLEDNELLHPPLGPPPGALEIPGCAARSSAEVPDIACTPNCYSMGALDDETSSMKWQHQ